MTILQIASQLMLHFSPEERSIPDASSYPGRNAAVLDAINGALQEVFGEASPWARFDERGVNLHPPTSVSIEVTEDSHDAVIPEMEWKPWFGGCSIVIAGSNVDNQIRNASRNVRLKYPHNGPSGTVTATVYQDCVTLGNDVLSVVAPVRIDRKPISPVPSPRSLVRRSTEDFGFHRQVVDPTVADRVADSTGTPVCYAIESWAPDDELAPVTRMALRPAAGSAAVLDYNAMLTPPVIQSIDSPAQLPVPFQFINLIFMPVATQRLTACPFFRPDTAALQEISRAYQAAIKHLRSLNPRKSAGTRLRPLY